MSKKQLIGLLISFLLVGCAATETAVPAEESAEQVVEVATAIPTHVPATPIPPTATATEILPTDTPHPTVTPIEVVPTETPTRKPTRVPITVKTYENIQYGVTQAQMLDIYQPQVDDPLPVLFLIGGWGFLKWEMYDPAEYYSRQGYNVVIYSRSLGAYPSNEQDTFCALAWIHANGDAYGFDTESVVPIGFLTGGTHAALLATVDEPGMYMEDCPQPLPEGNLIRAAISVNGFFDWSIWSLSDHAIVEEYFAYFDPANERSDKMAEASPVTWVDGTEPPIFLIHGDDDELVDEVQSEMFAVLLNEAGVEVELLVKNGLIHNQAHLTTSPNAKLPIKNYLTELFSE